MRPAEPPGRLLERRGDPAPRGMTVHDRTRLIGRLRQLFRLQAEKFPKIAQQTLGPGPLPSESPRLSARPLYQRGLWQSKQPGNL